MIISSGQSVNVHRIPTKILKPTNKIMSNAHWYIQLMNYDTNDKRMFTGWKSIDKQHTEKMYYCCSTTPIPEKYWQFNRITATLMIRMIRVYEINTVLMLHKTVR